MNVWNRLRYIHIRIVYDLILMTYNFSLTNDNKCYFFSRVILLCLLYLPVKFMEDNLLSFSIKNKKCIISNTIPSSCVVILSLRLWVVYEFDSRTQFILSTYFVYKFKTSFENLFLSSLHSYLVDKNPQMLFMFCSIFYQTNPRYDPKNLNIIEKICIFFCVQRLSQ